jgi:hypothetical protein
MDVFSWFRRNGRESDGRVREWRREWAQAVAAIDAEAPRRLRAALTASPPLASDIEVEEEMVDALERLIAMTDELASGRLPRVETAHRVVGADVCHYSVPVSMPDDPAQPSGRLLLTGSRAVFVGSAKLTTIPWHAAAQALRGDRDLMLVRADGQTGYRFRCNTYADALCGAAIARHLIEQTRAARRPADRGAV